MSSSLPKWLHADTMVSIKGEVLKWHVWWIAFREDGVQPIFTRKALIKWKDREISVNYRSQGMLIRYIPKPIGNCNFLQLQHVFLGLGIWEPRYLDNFRHWTTLSVVFNGLLQSHVLRSHITFWLRRNNHLANKLNPRCFCFGNYSCLKMFLKLPFTHAEYYQLTKYVRRKVAILSPGGRDTAVCTGFSKACKSCM